MARHDGWDMRACLYQSPPGGVGIIRRSALTCERLVLTALISIATGLLFGLVPALVSATGTEQSAEESPPG